MFVSCWSAKGGSGTTVVAVALASLLARSARAGSLLVDLCGDVPAALGMPEPDGPGLTDWFAAGGSVPVDALARLEMSVGHKLGLLHRGTGEFAEPGRAGVLAGLLAGDGRPVVVDCGLVDRDPARTLAAEATTSLLVTRPCFLALRRAAAAPVQPSGVVLVSEDGRALSADDVEDVIGAPVRAVVPRRSTRWAGSKSRPALGSACCIGVRVTSSNRREPRCSPGCWRPTAGPWLSTAG